MHAAPLIAATSVHVDVLATCAQVLTWAVPKYACASCASESIPLTAECHACSPTVTALGFQVKGGTAARHLRVGGRGGMVHGHQVSRQLPVGRLVSLVQHQVDEVEPGQQRRRQLDVVDDRQARVVAAADLRIVLTRMVISAADCVMAETRSIYQSATGETCRISCTVWRDFVMADRCQAANGFDEPFVMVATCRKRLAWADGPRQRGLAAHRVGAGQDAGARVEGGDDARLRHAHRLLLHHLVQLQHAHQTSSMGLAGGCIPPRPLSSSSLAVTALNV